MEIISSLRFNNKEKNSLLVFRSISEYREAEAQTFYTFFKLLFVSEIHLQVTVK